MPSLTSAQRLLRKNPYGSFDPGALDGEYGELTAGAVQRAKWELGYPATAGNSTFGPQLKAILSGKKPLPAAFKTRQAPARCSSRTATTPARRRSGSRPSTPFSGATATAPRSG